MVIHINEISGDDIIISGYELNCNERSMTNFLHKNEESEYKVFKYIYFIFDNTPLFLLVDFFSAKNIHIKNIAIIFGVYALFWSAISYLIPSSHPIFDFSDSVLPGSSSFIFCFSSLVLA